MKSTLPEKERIYERMTARMMYERNKHLLLPENMRLLKPEEKRQLLTDFKNIELAMCREEYATYVRYVHEGRWIPGKLHLFICNAVQDFLKRNTGHPYDVLLLSVPPQHGKSMTLTETLPSWYMGNHPYGRVIMGSYNKEQARKFGRRNKEKIVKFGKTIFGISLSAKKTADDNFELMNGISVCLSHGMRSGITGNPANLFIIDDPIKDREEADSVAFREKLWEIWQNQVKSRLAANAKIIVIQCMAHGTHVSMSDGTYKEIQHLCIGDKVLSWSKDKQIEAAITNLKAQGEDVVFEIKAQNATVVANARHPFLVQRDETPAWIKTSELQSGDMLYVSARTEFNKSASITKDEAYLLGYMFGDGWITKRKARNYDRLRDKYYPRVGYVTCCALSASEEENAMISSLFCALFGVLPKKTRYGYVRTETQSVGQWFIKHGLTGTAKTKRLPSFLFSEPIEIRDSFLLGFNSADGCVKKDKKERMRYIMASCNHDLMEDMRHLARSCGYLVTNICDTNTTRQAPHSPKPTQSKCSSFSYLEHKKVNTAFSLTRVVRITEIGRKPVFDVEVTGTENFLADGLVSHNTRWHEDDLYGRLEQSEKFVTKINIPCEAETDDLLGRKPGDALCPEIGKDNAWLKQFKQTYIQDPFTGGKRAWYAEYQGRPFIEGGTLIREEWFNYWQPRGFKLPNVIVKDADGKIYERTPVELPEYLDERIQSWDCTFRKTKDGDFVAGGVWGRRLKYYFKLDSVHKRMDIVDTMKEMERLDRKWPDCSVILVEAKANGDAIISLMQQKIGRILPTEPDRDKAARVRVVLGAIEAGNVFLPHPALADYPWVQEMLKECIVFPNSDHDDYVDEMSQALTRLMQNPTDTMATPMPEGVFRTENEKKDMGYGHVTDSYDPHNRQNTRRATVI